MKILVLFIKWQLGEYFLKKTIYDSFTLEIEKQYDAGKQLIREKREKARNLVRKNRPFH
jgi:hypothetical protein